jgi:hypothetical protein
MPSYSVKCPSVAYAERSVEVTAETDDVSVKRVSFELTGAISYSETVDYTGWKMFTCKTYASKDTGRVEVNTVFYDEHWDAKDRKRCQFDVVTS